MKRTRQQRAAAVTAKRPPGLRVHVRTVDSPRSEDREQVPRLAALLDERARDGRG